MQNIFYFLKIKFHSDDLKIKEDISSGMNPAKIGAPIAEIE